MGRLAHREEGSATLMGLDKQVSTSMCISSTTYSDSCADNANANMSKLDASASGRKVHAGFIMRNSSSLSTESSEFEFDACSFSELNDDPPISPKLLFSPNYTPNYSPNHSPDAETAFMTSTNQCCAETNHLHASNADYLQHQGSHDHLPASFTLKYGASSLKEKMNQDATSSQKSSSLSRAKSEGDDSGNTQIIRPNNDGKQESRGKFDGITVDNHSDNDNYGDPATGLRANYDVGEGRRRMNLRSLLNRRDLEQLSPLTNYNNQYKNDIKKQVPVSRNSSASSSNSASVSPSSSPLSYRTNHPTNPSKFEDDHPDYAGDTKSSCHKKNRKWAFKLDFLKKGLSPKANQSVNRSGSNDKHAEYSAHNHDVIRNQPDPCSTAAALDEAGFNDYLNRDRNYNAATTAGEPGITNNNQLIQRFDRFRAAAAAGEARFNRQINQSININHRAAAGLDATRDSRISNQQINQSNDRAGVITKFESPRQSTACSMISSVSSSPRHALSPGHAESEMIKANRRRISKSAPISPAGSPPRSSHAAAEGAFTHARAPMSPHALHYQQQRARTEELRRKTFLPYRQSLLGACFSPLSTPPHHQHHHNPQQAVY